MRTGGVASLLLASIVVGGAPAIALAQSLESTTQAGAHTATIHLPEGEVLVFLPSDAAPGDRISGAVYVTPLGTSDGAIARNRVRLRDWVLEFGDGAIVLDKDSTLSLELPEGDDQLVLVLKAIKRRLEEVTSFPLAKEPGPAPDRFETPAVGQTGRYVEITGPFDSDISTTECSLGGHNAMPLAESPRKAVFLSPEGIVGKAGIEVREGGNVVAGGTYRSLDVQIGADRFSLEKDEVATLWVNVAGLEDLDDPVDLDIHIGPPSIVSATGGNRQTLTILPADVREDGRYTREINVTGLQSGSWDAVATVVTP